MSSAARRSLSDLETLAPFADRHIGPRSDDVQRMLDVVGHPTLDALLAAAAGR